MKPSMKYGLAAIAVAGLAAVGVASAHGMFGPGGWRAVEENCNDAMTVGECRTSIAVARESAWLERCSEEYDLAFCEDLLSLQAAHRAELDALYSEYGVEAPVHLGFKSHGAGFDDARSDESCSDDMTVAQCREAHQAAIEAARLEACSEEYGDEFCQALFDLHAQHQAERQALYDEYGIEAPALGPGFPGDRPGHGAHHGHGAHRGHGFRHH